MIDEIAVKLKGASYVDWCTGCWVWKKGVREARWQYGVIRIGGVVHRAHRLSYQTFVGNIPVGMCVCHTCDNPRCINPAHLFLGSKGNNNRDRADKHRSHHKLTVEEIVEIRALAIDGKIRQKDIAAKFNICQQTVSDIKRGLYNTHV